MNSEMYSRLKIRLDSCNNVERLETFESDLVELSRITRGNVRNIIISFLMDVQTKMEEMESWER
jgi:hypothetical protein